MQLRLGIQVQRDLLCYNHPLGCEILLTGKSQTPKFKQPLQSKVPPMKTLGEIEAAICAGITRFEQDYMGRGPKEIHTYLIGDLLIVRLKGVLTAAEQQLVKARMARP